MAENGEPLTVVCFRDVPKLNELYYEGDACGRQHAIEWMRVQLLLQRVLRLPVRHRLCSACRWRTIFSTRRGGAYLTFLPERPATIQSKSSRRGRRFDKEESISLADVFTQYVVELGTAEKPILPGVNTRGADMNTER
jgi:hypothetical protein